MKRGYGFILIGLILLIFLFAYLVSTNPYNQAKRDRDFLGRDNASILVIEIGDYLDPLSAENEKNMKRLRTEYPVKFIYIHYAVSNLSKTAAMAAECAGSQDKFEDMHTKLFENYVGLDLDTIYALADEVGLRDEEFRDCMENEVYSSIIDRDLKIADKLVKDKLPVIFIDGERFDGLKDYSSYISVLS